MDYQNFNWQETAPGQYEREVDEIEQFYTSIAKLYEGIGHTIFAITACISLDIVLPADTFSSNIDEKVDDSFRRAWKQVRFDHPTLAAPVVYDPRTKKCKKVYCSPATESELNSWLSETFEVVDDGKTGEEFANSDPPIGPTPKLYIVKPVQDRPQVLRRDVVFRTSHDIIDGIGSFHLLNNFLLHASSTFASPDGVHTYVSKIGEESKNLSPPLRLAANIPSSPTASQSAKLASTRSLNNALGSTPTITTLSLPYSTHSPTPGKSQRASILLTASQTGSIIAACKARGVTPTQVVHSSIALALAELQTPTKDSQLGRYISYSLINLRKYCRAPYDGSQHAVSAYHCASALRLGIDVTIPSNDQGADKTQAVQREENWLGQEFEAAVKQVKQFSQDTRVDADFLAIVPTLFASVTPPYLTSPLPTLPPINTKPSVSLSSLGIIDQVIQPSYQSFKITSPPWVVGGEYSTGYGLFFGTWNGRMELNAAYNESYHEREEALLFLERVMEIAMRGLGVESK